MEMLVSVTLVLMMMAMFASIFSMATDSVGKQRGISNNDQRARSLVTILQGDFQHRTFRNPIPYFPGEDPSTSPTPFGNRAGYLYISTNDQYSGLDDIVQFTVNSDILIEDTDSFPYFGRAQLLLDRSANPVMPGVSVSPNQPEADDGSLELNGAGSSNAAEVVYYVRNGNLYRRVMLLRKPLPISGRELNDQPSTFRGDRLLPPGNFSVINNNNTDDFWRYFDYSAYAEVSGASQNARFLGLNALSNEPIGAANESLGVSRYRFGFNQYNGISREHTSDNLASRLFIGRFTHAETSAPNFNWPHGNSQPTGLAWTGNPFYAGNPVTLDQSTGVVTEFSGPSGRGGERRMEDLVLANVHEMKVEIWDDRLLKYTVPGHNETNPVTGEVGDYHMGRNLNPFLSPSGVANGSVFDTWHCAANTDLNSSGAIEIAEQRPPYLAYRYYPPRLNDAPAGPSPNGTPQPIRPYWVAGVYSPGDVVFSLPGTNQTFTVCYRCVRGGQSGLSSPLFPARFGQRIQDNEVEWESIDNSRPLSSIRITLRFMDQTSDTQRQLSLIIPLTDKK